jgi:hypothetical protein
MSNRINDERSAIVIIMQRLHENDVSGDILARQGDYCHCTPMYFDPSVPSKRRRRAHRGPGEAGRDPARASAAAPPRAYHFPVLGIDFHGSAGGSASPFCSNSIDCLSGERTNAIMPSRGGRLMVTPAFFRRSHTA